MRRVLHVIESLAPGGIETARLLPALEIVAAREHRGIERGFVARQGVRGAEMVPAGTDVRVASKFSSFAKKAGDLAEPQCLAGAGKKVAIAVEGITEGARHGCCAPSSFAFDADAIECIGGAFETGGTVLMRLQNASDQCVGYSGTAHF